MFRRLRPAIVFYLSGALLFEVFRVVFLLHNKGTIRKATVADWLNCLRVGWFYDTAVLCYILAPAVLILLLVPWRWFNGRLLRVLAAAVATFWLAGFLLACVCDLFFFDHYADRLNYQVFSYPVYRLEVLAMIWDKYPLGWMLALVGLIAVACYTFFRRVGWPRPDLATPPLAASISDRMIGAVVFGAAAMSGCLGPPERPARDVSPSYVCREHVVNRASLNCVATLTRAFLDIFADNNLRPAEYGFVEPALAHQAARQLILSPRDVPLTQPDDPLARISPAAPLPAGGAPPNVVVIVMESLASQYVGSLGGANPWTPELEAVARRGIMFENFYAVGTRTSRGLVGTLGGFPDLPGVPLAQRKQMRGPFLTLPNVLRDRGYRTLFIHGGNLKFNDVRSFIAGHGFETIVDRGDFDAYVEQQKRDPVSMPTAFTTFWSVDDQSVFVRANQMLRQETRPFFAVILTLTNHPTYEVPHDVFDLTVRKDQASVPADMTEEERAVRYADWAVGDFFRRAGREKYFANTIFVLTGDHCRDQRGIYPVDAPNFHIYGAMVGPDSIVKNAPTAVNRDGALRIATVGSQADLAPTILARLGQPFAHCFVGRDLLTTPPNEGFALLQQNGSIGFVRGDKLMCISPGLPHPAIRGFRILPDREQAEWGGGDNADETRELAELHHLGSGLFQTAAEVFQAGHHRVRN
ncbi:MAG: sulfatase-like hydrolase/transferase [Phycisphaerae bacterium]|nr:sulfatase-like hydrolase/transferase [Phycisphaerae bacterium]